MHFLIDVHLPISLSKYLDGLENIQAKHVNQILQRWNTEDADICAYADKDDMVVISKDVDFKNSHFINNTPRKLIRVGLGNCTNAALLELFKKYLPFILPLGDRHSFYVEVSQEYLTFIE